MTTASQIAASLDDMLERAERISLCGLSIEAQSTALALLFTLNIGVIRKAAELARASA